MTKRIGILGSGMVGQVLAKGFSELGCEVKLANRTGKSVDDWAGEVGMYAEVAAWAEVVVLTVKGSAAEEVVAKLKTELADKTVLDTTNPIAEEPPENGVIKYFTSLDESLMERLQLAAPDANFVKAFNSVGNAHMVNPMFKNGPPTMFICGDNSDAKAEAAELIKSLGWEVTDMGSVISARAIEPLCMLWCIPGMLTGNWSHAFKLLS